MTHKKTGGRQKDTINKRTKELFEEIGPGELPLAYMVRVMRDKKVDDHRRDDMAAKAAGYLHPRLAATEIKTDPIELIHKIERIIVCPPDSYSKGISTASGSAEV